MELDRPALRVGSDIDHSSNTGGDDVSRAVMARECRRVMGPSVDLHSSTRGIRKRGHFRLHCTHELDDVAKGRRLNVGEHVLNRDVLRNSAFSFSRAPMSSAIWRRCFRFVSPPRATSRASFESPSQ